MAKSVLPYNSPLDPSPIQGRNFLLYRLNVIPYSLQKKKDLECFRKVGRAG